MAYHWEKVMRYIYHLVLTLINNKNSTAILIMFDETHVQSNHGLRYFNKITDIRNTVERNFQHINQKNENKIEIDITSILKDRVLILFDNGLAEQNNPTTLTYFPFNNVTDNSNKK